MKIKWHSIYDDYFKIKYEIIDVDKLSINGGEFICDFSDTSIYEYTIPEELKGYILVAKRSETSGELYLDLIYSYSKEEINIWQNNNWNNSGSYRGNDYEDYNSLAIIPY